MKSYKKLNIKLGVIGCGNMGSALVKGIVTRGILSASTIKVSDKDLKKVRYLYKKFGVRISSNEGIARTCHVIILSVKPQDAASLLESIAKALKKSVYLISVMAGVTISKIDSFVKRPVAATRAMPNMAALVGESITCISHNRHVKNKKLARSIFASIGDVVEVEEKDMDAVTAISGSGPAYFFYLVETLIKSGTKLGLKKETAEKLAFKTALGSAALLNTLSLKPDILRKKVTSKGGTTEAAFKVFVRRGLQKIFQEGIKKAKERSKQLRRG